MGKLRVSEFCILCRREFFFFFFLHHHYPIFFNFKIVQRMYFLCQMFLLMAFFIKVCKNLLRREFFEKRRKDFVNSYILYNFILKYSLELNLMIFFFFFNIVSFQECHIILYDFSILFL